MYRIPTEAVFYRDEGSLLFMHAALMARNKFECLSDTSIKSLFLSEGSGSTLRSISPPAADDFSPLKSLLSITVPAEFHLRTEWLLL